MFDIVTIGHFVIDLIISPIITRPKLTLGGPVTFTSIAASKLSAKVGVISKVGKDFKKHSTLLQKNNVDMSNVKVTENTLTTRFVLSYSNGKRKLQLKNKAPQIFPDDIPSSLHAKAIHLAPVTNELSLEVIQRLRPKTPLLSVDPQGFLREFDAVGNMKLKTLDDLSFLRNCDIFKSSIQEVRMITGQTKLGASFKKIRNIGAKVILITMGRKGILANFSEKFYHIPACKPKIYKDATGGGDSFIGAFLAEYIKGREPLWCCCVGSAAASFVMEDVGSQRFGGKDDVYNRATKIYKKGIKPMRRNSVV